MSTSHTDRAIVGGPVQPITPNNRYDEFRRRHPWWLATVWTPVFGGVLVTTVAVSDGDRLMIALVAVVVVVLFVVGGLQYAWTADRPERRFRDRLRAIRAERPLAMAAMYIGPPALLFGARPLIDGERVAAAVALAVALGAGAVVVIVNVELRNYARGHGLHPFGDGLHGDSAWMHEGPVPSDDPRRPRW